MKHSLPWVQKEEEVLQVCLVLYGLTVRKLIITFKDTGLSFMSYFFTVTRS